MSHDDGAPISLEALRQAFLRPRFALWVGRKSCPLAHPLAPTLVESETLEAAFSAHAAAAKLDIAPGPTMTPFDARLWPPAAANNARRHRRLDEPGDRARWHF